MLLCTFLGIYSLNLQEMQDPTSMKQYGMGSFDCSLDELNFQSVSAESYSSYPDLNPKSTYDYNGLAIENTRITGLKRPAKQLKTSSWNSCTTDRITSMAASSSSSQIICFENRSSAPPNSHQIYGLDCTVKAKNEALSDRNMNFPTSISESSFEMQNCTPAHDRVPDTTTRTSLRAQDHVMAERKRREKLSQRFIALSTILPSLKKVKLVPRFLRLVLEGPIFHKSIFSSLIFKVVLLQFFPMMRTRWLSCLLSINYVLTRLQYEFLQTKSCDDISVLN